MKRFDFNLNIGSWNFGANVNPGVTSGGQPPKTPPPTKPFPTMVVLAIGFLIYCIFKR